MKTILCYGASNVWGFIPGSWNVEKGLAARYAKNERWTGVLQKELGNEYDIIEEGLNGRTTMFDDTVAAKPYRNGLTQLPVCLEAHYPINLVIFMLGTNDTKIQYSSSVEKITTGMRKLVHVVKESNKGPDGVAPEILVIAPQPIVKTAGLSDQFNDGSIQQSILLTQSYQKMAQEEGCSFLDISHIKSSLVDGIHLEVSGHREIGLIVAQLIKLKNLAPRTGLEPVT